MDERWLPAVGYEGVYEVSDLGRVRRIGAARGATPGRVLKATVNRSGYLVVRLTVGARSVKAFVHRLVAMAHIGPPPSATHEVNHKDRDRLNPRATNLEWVTRSENIRHAITLGVTTYRGEDNVGHKLTWDDVVAIRSSSAGARELGRRYGVHHKTICDIRAGRKWRRRPEIEATLTRGRSS